MKSDTEISRKIFFGCWYPDLFYSAALLLEDLPQVVSRTVHSRRHRVACWHSTQRLERSIVNLNMMRFTLATLTLLATTSVVSSFCPDVTTIVLTSPLVQQCIPSFNLRTRSECPPGVIPAPPVVPVRQHCKAFPRCFDG
jgi:hypothetical protein